MSQPERKRRQIAGVFIAELPCPISRSYLCGAATSQAELVPVFEHSSRLLTSSITSCDASHGYKKRTLL
jgi:hypothetical protein